MSKITLRDSGVASL